MSDSGIQVYTPLLLHLLIAVFLASAISAASVLSLTVFHLLTVAGLGAQVIVLYWLGMMVGAV